MSKVTMDLSRCTRMTDNDKEMVQDGINAVTRAEMWDYMAKPSTPGEDGFMFSTDIELEIINKKIQYGGHSGSSYGWTMRQVQYIAKNGFDAYVDLMNGGSTRSARPFTPIPPPVTPVPVVMPIVAIPDVSPVHNRANTGGAMPRHVCMCRDRQGLTEGWCGVAGGGVPACEH